MHSQDDSMPLKPKWYFTREEIEEHSPSRKDGIDYNYESHLRQSYCTYIQKLGEALKVPQMTIATALMLCHRFYMHQSHAKNHWQTIANASMFLACKSEETPRWLKDLIVVAYKLMYSWDPLASKKIREKEVYDKQKQLILMGEQLILVTVAFDLNIEHPYKLLTAALKRLGTPPKQVVQVAWNYVNDSLRTTLCLQYKPHYIAAGSIFLAAKCQKIKLPSANGKKWWMQFDVSPKQLEEVIQHMIRLLEPSNVHAMAAPSKTINVSKPSAQNRESGISESHNSSRSTSDQDSINRSLETCRILSKPAIVKCSQKQASYDAHETAHKKENCTSDTGSANSVVEDGDAEIVTGDSNHNTSCKIVSVKEKIDISRIREKLKRRKLEKRKSGDEILSDVDAWIEREIEKGVESISALY